MKAKVIKTGEVIDVRQVTIDGWAFDDVDSVRFFYESDLDFDYCEWDVFRREAAKDILPSLIMEASKIYGFESLNKGIWSEQAVEWADELIKQLRRKNHE